MRCKEYTKVESQLRGVGDQALLLQAMLAGTAILAAKRMVDTDQNTVLPIISAGRLFHITIDALGKIIRFPDGCNQALITGLVSD